MTTPPAATAASLTLPGIEHGFFGSRGGVSSGIYASLNAGPGSSDDPANVRENRSRIATALNAEHLISMHQVHSATALTVTAPWPGRWPEADGIATNVPGLALCALSADCTPVLFADPQARVIGAAHAGWRGALAGVLEATLTQMQTLGAQRERIVAAIGPTIAQASYEVGPELEQQFRADDETSARFFAPGRGDRFQFDLPGYCVQRLTHAGLAHIENLALDTYTRPDEFFSARRNNHSGERDYGRNCAAIVLSA